MANDRMSIALDSKVDTAYAVSILVPSGTTSARRLWQPQGCPATKRFKGSVVGVQSPTATLFARVNSSMSKHKQTRRLAVFVFLIGCVITAALAIWWLVDSIVNKVD